MSPQTRRPTCQWLKCPNPCVAEVTAQWTLFDWLDTYVCEDHVLDMRDLLLHRLVDGEPPVDVWTKYWSDST